jgi:predicted PurR-regulated permease PerM
MVLGPLIWIGVLFVDQASSLDLDPAYERLQEHLPTINAWLDDALHAFGAPEVRDAQGHVVTGPLQTLIDRVQADLPGAASKVFSTSTLRGALNLLLAPFFFLFGLLVALVTQYFLYRESPRLRAVLLEISPLDDVDTDRILQTLRGATVSAIVGGLLVAVAQGALGTVMFLVAGIQSPVLWGVVMAAFSLLPFGGTALIWAPAGLYLLFTGEAGSGWFVLLFGTVIVGSADNVLRPLVLSRMGGEDVQIHPMMLFFAILSGIGLFGISGLVFGPLLIALLTTLVRIYRRHFLPGGRTPAPETGSA